MADGWGGKRRGAGRKPKLTTMIRELTIDQANGDAQYALGLLANIMRDETQPIDRRMAAATLVMDRVWGKPTQHNDNTESGELVIRVIREPYAPYGNDQTANAPPGATADSG